MKKKIAILLSAVMLLTAFSSLAENERADVNIDTVSSASIPPYNHPIFPMRPVHTFHR